MRDRVVSALRNYLLREATISHLAVAMGVLIISATFSVAPLGKTYEPQLAHAKGSVAPAAQAIVLQAGAEGSASKREDGLSSRGERPTPVAAPPERTASVSPTTPVSTLESTVVSTRVPNTPTPAPPPPTPIPSPPSPTPIPPTAVPTAVPTAAPTAVPPTATPAPAVQARQFRVGIQAGHWKESELPAELASLRGATGASGSGWREVDVNLNVAQRVADILRSKGVVVDLMPATVPSAYKADAFLAIHGDANSNQAVSGYKLARARWSKIPDKDDALIQAVSGEYSASTDLKFHSGSITENMRQYYAFNWPQLDHAVASTTPSAIIELGFLTTSGDRKLLLEQPDRAASGIANGMLRFLGLR